MVLQLPFVQQALVEYDESNSSKPFEDLQRSAIVTVRSNGNGMLETYEVKTIRDLVRGAVAGLNVSDIVVVDANASRSYSGEAVTENRQPLMQAKSQEVTWYESNIRNALIAYPGIRVNVEVAIDPVLYYRQDVRTLDGDPLVVKKRVKQQALQRPVTRQVPFLVAGTNGQAKVESWPQRFEETEMMSSGTYESTEKAGMTVKQVSVSIGIPERCVQYILDREMQGLADRSPPILVSEADRESRKEKLLSIWLPKSTRKFDHYCRPMNCLRIRSQ